MATFYATGRLTLEGVTFEIEAGTLAEARAKVEGQRFDNYEITPTAAAVDWTMSLRTLKEND